MYIPMVIWSPEDISIKTQEDKKMAKFLTLDKEEMVSLVFKMLLANQNRAWGSYYVDEFSGNAHCYYDFSKIRRICSMVSDWNFEHDGQEIYIDYDFDTAEADEIYGVEDFKGGEVVRVYIEDYNYIFPET